MDTGWWASVRVREAWGAQQASGGTGLPGSPCTRLQSSPAMAHWRLHSAGESTGGGFDRQCTCASLPPAARPLAPTRAAATLHLLRRPASAHPSARQLAAIACRTCCSECTGPRASASGLLRRVTFDAAGASGRPLWAQAGPACGGSASCRVDDEESQQVTSMSPAATAHLTLQALAHGESRRAVRHPPRSSTFCCRAAQALVPAADPPHRMCNNCSGRAGWPCRLQTSLTPPPSSRPRCARRAGGPPFKKAALPWRCQATAHPRAVRQGTGAPWRTRCRSTTA